MNEARPDWRSQFRWLTLLLLLLLLLAHWPLHDIAITNIVWYELQFKGSGGNNILRNSVGDRGEWGAQPKGEFAHNIMDSCTQAFPHKNIL